MFSQKWKLCLVVIFGTFLLITQPIYATPITTFTDPVSGREVWQMTNGSQFEGPDYYTNILFSPNGKYFVYDDTSSPSSLSIMNSDGSNKRTLGTSSTGDPTFGWWSHDSTYYYSSSGLYRYKVETNQREQIPNASAASPFYYPMLSPDGRVLSGIANANDTSGQGVMKFINVDGTNYRAFNAPVQPSGTGFDVTHGWVGNNYAWYLNNSVNGQYRDIERVIDINTGQYMGTLNAVDPNGTSWVGIFDHPILSEEGYMAGGGSGLIAGFGSYWGMANTDFASGFNPTTRQLRRVVESSQYPTFGSVSSLQNHISPDGKWILNYMVNNNCSVMAMYPVDKASSPQWLAVYGPSSKCDYDSYYGAYGSFSPDSTKVIFGSSYNLPNRDNAKSPAKPDIYIAVFKKPDAPTNLSVQNGQLTWKPAFNHREIKEYEIYQASSQNGTYQKTATVPALYTYLDAPSKISSSQNTINVDSTTGFANQGVIEIFGLSSQRPTELVAYTGKTATSFTGCTRGYAGSLAAEHYNDAFVWQYTGNHGYNLSATSAWYKARSVEWSGLASELSSAVFGNPTGSPQPTPSPVLPVCFGNDNLINRDDVVAWANNYNLNNSALDITPDSVINGFEFAYLTSRWGQSCTK